MDVLLIVDPANKEIVAEAIQAVDATLVSGAPKSREYMDAQSLIAFGLHAAQHLDAVSILIGVLLAKSIKIDIRVDLKRHAYCEKRLIVHDQMRVWDVKRLMLQALVWPSMFSYAAHIVQSAADMLIANDRTQGARVLIDAFFERAENLGL